MVSYAATQARCVAGCTIQVCVGTLYLCAEMPPNEYVPEVKQHTTAFAVLLMSEICIWGPSALLLLLLLANASVSSSSLLLVSDCHLPEAQSPGFILIKRKISRY